MHLDEGLGLDVSEAAENPIAAGDAVDHVILVKAGEGGKVGAHGPGMTDRVHGILDAADVGMSLHKPGDEGWREVGASACGEVV